MLTQQCCLQRAVDVTTFAVSLVMNKTKWRQLHLLQWRKVVEAVHTHASQLLLRVQLPSIRNALYGMLNSTLALAHWHWHTGIGTLALDIWTQRKCFTALKFEHSGQIWKSSVIAYEYCTVSCVERSMFFSESDITCNQFSPCYVLAVMQMDTSSTWNFQAPTLFTSNTYSQIARQWFQTKKMGVWARLLGVQPTITWLLHLNYYTLWDQYAKQTTSNTLVPQSASFAEVVEGKIGQSFMQIMTTLSMKSLYSFAHNKRCKVLHFSFADFPGRAGWF